MNTHHSAHDNYRVRQPQNSFMDKSRIYQRYFYVHLVIQYSMCPLGRHQRIFLPPLRKLFHWVTQCERQVLHDICSLVQARNRRSQPSGMRKIKVNMMIHIITICNTIPVYSSAYSILNYKPDHRLHLFIEFLPQWARHTLRALANDANVSKRSYQPLK